MLSSVATPLPQKMVAVAPFKEMIEPVRAQTNTNIKTVEESKKQDVKSLPIPNDQKETPSEVVEVQDAN